MAAPRSRPSPAAARLPALLAALLLAVSRASASLTPLIDYIIPVWPSVSCGKPGFDPPICPTADGICQAPAPSAPLANYLSQVQARVAAFPNFFYFTAQCKNSLVLRGAAECYFVFDQTALRTGIAAIKNVAPYPGISLLTCVLQLDAGPPKTSANCFDKGGVDPAHPYVVARVESGVPEYNLQQVRGRGGELLFFFFALGFSFFAFDGYKKGGKLTSVPFPPPLPPPQKKMSTPGEIRLDRPGRKRRRRLAAPAVHAELPGAQRQPARVRVYLKRREKERETFSSGSFSLFFFTFHSYLSVPSN